MTHDRKTALGLLARADPKLLNKIWADAGFAPHGSFVRGPEVGLVMVEGRAGGTGAPFNLGEMTVTRASFETGGTVGHAVVAGREPAKARIAAMVDALMQRAEADDVQRTVIAPLMCAEEASRAARRAEVQATKVEFFTMMRGEDE